MWKLLRVPLVALTLFATSTGLTHWTSVHTPEPLPPSLTDIFTEPDGRGCESLCLFGIQPGRTSFDEAGDLLKKHLFTRSFSPNMAGDIFRSGPMGIIITWGLGDYRVSRVELFITNQVKWGSLGQIKLLYGTPERVMVDKSYTRAYRRGGQMEFTHAHLRAGFLSPDDPLAGIAVQTVPDGLLSKTVPWQGFNAIERYSVAVP